MRISSACFLATAAVFALQWIPFTGIFLMFMLAPLWSVVLINAGFLAMIFEALSGLRPRWTLAFPLLYFGGYYAIAVFQHVAVNEQIAALASKPMELLEFDASNGALEADFADDDVADDLLKFYNLPVAIRRINADNLPIVFRRKPGCETAQRLTAGKGILRYTLADDPCIIEHREAYNEPAATIKSVGYRKGRAGDTGGSRIVLTAPDGSQATIDDGWYAALSWFPMPVMGCGVNDAQSTWKCAAYFNRDEVRILTPTDGISGRAVAVAKALGLQRARIH